MDNAQLPMARVLFSVEALLDGRLPIYNTSDYYHSNRRNRYGKASQGKRRPKSAATCLRSENLDLLELRSFPKQKILGHGFDVNRPKRLSWLAKRAEKAQLADVTFHGKWAHRNERPLTAPFRDHRPSEESIACLTKQPSSSTVGTLLENSDKRFAGQRHIRSQTTSLSNRKEKIAAASAIAERAEIALKSEGKRIVAKDRNMRTKMRATKKLPSSSGTGRQKLLHVKRGKASRRSEVKVISKAKIQAVNHESKIQEKVRNGASSNCTDIVLLKKSGMITKEDKVDLQEWHAASSVCSEYEQKEDQTNMIETVRGSTKDDTREQVYTTVTEYIEDITEPYRQESIREGWGGYYVEASLQSGGNVIVLVDRNGYPSTKNGRRFTSHGSQKSLDHESRDFSTKQGRSFSDGTEFDGNRRGDDESYRCSYSSRRDSRSEGTWSRINYSSKSYSEFDADNEETAEDFSDSRFSSEYSEYTRQTAERSDDNKAESTGGT